jgi:hypothetical protein
MTGTAASLDAASEGADSSVATMSWLSRPLDNTTSYVWGMSSGNTLCGEKETITVCTHAHAEVVRDPGEARWKGEYQGYEGVGTAILKASMAKAVRAATS